MQFLAAKLFKVAPLLKVITVHLLPITDEQTEKVQKMKHVQEFFTLFKHDFVSLKQLKLWVMPY